MNFSRVLLFNAAMALWTALVALCYMPCLIFSAQASRRIGKPWAKGTLFLAKKICHIDYKVEGHEHIRQGPVIYACKHQSALEITILMSIFPAPAFVLRRSLLFLPFFGQYLWRMRMIAIDRKGGIRSMKIMLAHCLAAVRELRPIAIFPEGTRVAPGQKGRYHPGVAAIYQHLKVPVIPVATNAGLYWPKNRWIKHSGTAIIRFLPAIEPGLKPRAFLKALEGSIESHAMMLYEHPIPPA